MDALIERLPARCPADDGVVALDARRLPHRQPDVRAEARASPPWSDWELSTLGHPLADLGYLCMALRCRATPPCPAGGLDRAALGIPPSRDAARIRRLSGRAIPQRLAFVLAFSYFRLAASRRASPSALQQAMPLERRPPRRAP
jgi:hypothetical protein